MRCFYLAGVAILTFVACGDTKGTRILISDFSNQHQDHVSSVVSNTRLLRTTSIADASTGGEERVGGVPISRTDKIAKILKFSKVTDEQLQKWLGKGKTAESVFYRLNLENTLPTRLFTSPKFSRWLQYADGLSASGKGASAISILSTKYGDDTLYKMIGLAKKESTTKALGTRLQTEQLEHWVKVGKDPEEVFKLYDLNSASSRILSKSEFSDWTKYVDDLNAKNEGAMASIIPTMKKYYSDHELFLIILAAKGVDETEAMGTKLEDAFVQFWIHRKETPDNVLVELGLKKPTRTLLQHPLLNILIKYTEAYNVNYAAKKTTVIETLTRTFDDDRVARILHVGMEKSSTKEIAKKFQADQLEMWLNNGQSVDDVYKLLKLPRPKDLVSFGGDKILDTWLAYMNVLSIKNPEKTSAIFTTLAPTFRDKPMMQILEAANKFPNMEKAATKLQLEKADNIFSTGISPYKAFTLVALDEVGDSVLSSPLFKKFMIYADDYNKKNPANKESWFLALCGEYSDRVDKIIDKAMKDPSTMELAKLVEKELMKDWLVRSEYSPRIAFQYLHLQEAGQQVFSSPKFELWVKYLDDWNQAYPSKKTTMIDELLGNIHDMNLVPILEAAEKVPNTKMLASQLQDALVEKWIADKESVTYVKLFLTRLSSSDDMLERYTKKLNSV